MIKPPEYAALINPIGCNAFAMRFLKRVDLEIPFVFKPLGSDPTHSKVNLFCHTLDTVVCDATMFISPFVTFVTPMSPEVAAQMCRVRLTVLIDGDKVVDAEPLRHFMVLPPFERSGLDTGTIWVGRNEDSLLGGSRLHFIPSEGIIEAYIDRIPEYSPDVGEIHLTVGAILALYTTKLRQGLLNDVGALDEHQNAVQVSRTWGSTDPLADVHAEANRLAEIRAKEEIQYGPGAGVPVTGEMKRLLEEYKRLTEDKKLREKAEKAKAEAEAEAEANKADLARRVLAVAGPPHHHHPHGDPQDELSADLDKTVARATRRLVRMALVATLTLVSAVAALIYFADIQFFDILKR